MESAFFDHLVTFYAYSVPAALKIVDYLRAHPTDFVVFRNSRKVNFSRLVIWVVQYRGVIIENDKLLKFIQNDCLPF